MLNCRYEYDYNGKGLVTTKKYPGCQPVIYDYDEADRVIMMQGGELRALGRSRYYVYDGLGRLTSQYTKLGSICTDELINYYDDYVFLDLYPSLPPFAITDEPEYSHCRLTGKWQATSNGDGTLTTFEYDERGHLIKSSEVGLGGRISCCDFSYTYWDDLNVQNTNYYERVGNTLIEKFRSTINNDYYPRTKLLHSTVCTLRGVTNTESFTDTICNLIYDEFGYLSSNSRGGTLVDMMYSYDKLHGWS